MSSRPSRFSPRSESYAALEERTVGRRDIRAELVQALEGAVRSGQARFELVIGPRGSGKSHLLGLVEGQLRDALEGAAVVVGLPEEFHPSSLVHLLAEILRTLPADPEIGPVSTQLAILATTSANEVIDRAVEMLRGRLRDLPMVLIIENLDVVLGAIGRQGQLRLRRILQTQSSWSVAATSRAWAPAFSKESEPFYGTFKFRELGPLDAQCCRELLVRLARQHGRDALAEELDTPDGLARVQTIRHVLGGYPRAMSFIFPHLQHDRKDDVEQAIQELAEELTPYFQEQMSRLSPGQRPVAELLAEHWHPLSVTEISQLTFTPPASTSTHLRHLRRDAIVRRIKIGRECYYEISEPMFRIARSMKRTNLRARTFIKVLRAWYRLRGGGPWDLMFRGNAELIDYDVFEPGAYHQSFIDDLKAGHSQRVIDRLEAESRSDSVLFGCWIVALARSGRAAQALRELASASDHEIWNFPPITAALNSFGENSTGKQIREFILRDTTTDIERLGVCLAMTTLGEHSSTARESGDLLVDYLNRATHSERSAMDLSSIVIRYSAPMRLALRSLFASSGRLFAALAPSSTLAFHVNLWLALRHAWNANSIQEFATPLPADLRAWAKALRSNAAISVIESLSDPDPAARAHALAAAKDDEKDEHPADQLWNELYALLCFDSLARLPTLTHLSELSSEQRTAVTKGLPIAMLFWIAAGRDLAPLNRIYRHLSSETDPERLLLSNDPDVEYARLAAPERTFVLQEAARFDPQRHATLKAIASDEP